MNNTMSKMSDYRIQLRELPDWDAYLLAQSGLPGPRGNLELAQAAALEGEEKLFLRYLQYTPEIAPVNSPYEFLAFCGVLGLGRLTAEGSDEFLKLIRSAASDPRWRIREAVAMAMQLLGDADMEKLITELIQWSEGNLYEKRAAAAAICEPRLLMKPQYAIAALHILERITESVETEKNRKNEAFIALRKGLGYCWSVAVAALPDKGKKCMERWFSSVDKDIRWIMRENLKKNRLMRMDSNWTDFWFHSLQ